MLEYDLISLKWTILGLLKRNVNERENKLRTGGEFKM